MFGLVAMDLLPTLEEFAVDIVVGIGCSGLNVLG